MTIQDTISMVAQYRKALIDLDEAITALDPTGVNVEEIADLLVEFNLYKRDVGVVYDTLADIFATAMKRAGVISGRDGAEIELKYSLSRTGWKHRDLAAAVATKIYESSVDMDTGEFVGSPLDMMQKMLDYLQPSYWKIGEVSKIGINVDDYCKSEEAKPSVIVRKGNAQ
jgi:hypothetical protein